MSLNQIEKEQMMQFVQERTAEACLRRTEKRMKLVLLTLMRKLWSWRRGLILLLTPIFFVFIPILMNGKVRTIYVCICAIITYGIALLIVCLYV